MGVIINLLAGIVFGMGLVLSGMIDPAKVTNFLDIFGQWDPSLAFVMAGAVVVTAAGYALVQRRKAPVLAPRFELPPTSPIDAQLISGAGIFGIGWGLGGFCPGPAIASMGVGAYNTFVFVAAMLAGAAIAAFMRQSKSK